MFNLPPDGQEPRGSSNKNLSSFPAKIDANSITFSRSSIHSPSLFKNKHGTLSVINSRRAPYANSGEDTINFIRFADKCAFEKQTGIEIREKSGTPTEKIIAGHSESHEIGLLRPSRSLGNVCTDHSIVTGIEDLGFSAGAAYHDSLERF